MLVNADELKTVYAEELKRAIEEHPDQYWFGVDAVHAVVEKMFGAFRKRCYNKDTPAIKGLCKRMGIKHTYRDINAFFAELGI